MEEEFEKPEPVEILQSPGGHWAIWQAGCKVDDEGVYRSSLEAAAYARSQGWDIGRIASHIEEKPYTPQRPKLNGYWYDKPQK